MFNLTSKFKLATMLASLTIFAFTSNVANAAADVSSVDGYEKVVISLKTDPTKDPEPACVALQIGMNLLMSFPEATIPADAVTLFVTTGGVELINPDNSIYNRTKPKAVCTTPGDNMSLQDLLLGFEGLGGEVVISPLCVKSRGITEFTAGKPANAAGIHNLWECS